MIARLTITVLLYSLSLSAAGQKEQKKEYPIMISFVSYGSGVPGSKPVMNFIRSFEKKYKTAKIKMDTIGHRGREGEYNLGLSLNELSAKQKKAFIQQIKKVTKQTGDRGEIQYEENVALDDANDPVRAKPQAIKIE